MRRPSLLLLCALILTGCSENDLDSWPLVAEDAAVETAEDDRFKLDILFIVDASASMSSVQVSVGKSVAALITELESAGPVDIRAAVTTTLWSPDEENRLGRLVSAPAENYPILSARKRTFPALVDRPCNCAAATGWETAFACETCSLNGDCPENAPDCSAYETCLSTGTHDYEWFGFWKVSAPSFGAAIFNLNGSVNSRCTFDCTHELPTLLLGDATCHEHFGDDRLFCSYTEDPISGEVTDWGGCIPRTPSDDCPAPLPEVLGGSDEEEASLGNLPCLLSPGALMDTHANLEHGIGAAWAALDPNGHHATVVCDRDDAVLEDAGLTPSERRASCERRFLRPGAKLLLVFVSDEEDCTIAEGKSIGGGDYAECGLLGDEDTPDDFVGFEAIAEGSIQLDNKTDLRPLATVASYVNRLKSLTASPEDVFVATIVGDVVRAGETITAEQRQERVDLYYASLTDRTNSYRANSYSCFGADGIAFLGSRYHALVEAFGDHGVTTNICQDDGLESNFRAIGAAVNAAFR